MSKIKIILKMHRTYDREMIIEYNPEMTLLDLNRMMFDDEKDWLDFGFDSYYDMEIYQINSNLTPYIIIDNKVYFDYQTDKIKFKDIVNTHKIDISEGIIITYDRGKLDSFEWDFIIECFVTVATVLGFVCDSASIVKWIKEKCGKNGPTNPVNIQKFLYTRNMWNQHEVSELFEISIEHSKMLLKIAGYDWNNTKKIYEITDEVKEEKIAKLEDVIYKVIDEYENNNEF